MLNHISGHAKADGTVPGFVMAQVADAFFNNQLAGCFAKAGHADQPGILADAHRGGTSGVTGGFGFSIHDVVAVAALHKVAAGHQLHGVVFAVLLHGAFDGDEVIFFNRFCHNSLIP